MCLAKPNFITVYNFNFLPINNKSNGYTVWDTVYLNVITMHLFGSRFIISWTAQTLIRLVLSAVELTFSVQSITPINTTFLRQVSNMKPFTSAPWSMTLLLLVLLDIATLLRTNATSSETLFVPKSYSQMTTNKHKVGIPSNNNCLVHKSIQLQCNSHNYDIDPNNLL